MALASPDFFIFYELEVQMICGLLPDPYALGVEGYFECFFPLMLI